jgi:RNA polymerase sigma-70 factor, ECF subfamily
MPDNRNLENEITLIKRAQYGDRDAYGELVHIYYRCVVDIVYHMCGDPGLAEDAAQEAFLRAWIKLPSFHLDYSMRNWLCRIAVNAAVDVLRRKSERKNVDEEVGDLIAKTPGPEDMLIEKEQAVFLQQAMKFLPEASRTVLVLREFTGLSYQEIASVLDIPMGTVMSRLNYARNRLRELLVAQTVQQEHEYA